MQMSFAHTQTFKQSLVVSQQLRQAIVLLRMTNSELQTFIEGQSEENPFVALAPTATTPAPMLRSPSEASAAAGEDWDRIAALPDNRGPSLYTYVAEQIGKLGLSEKDIDLASVFVDALEPSGWLGQSVEAIAAHAGVPEARADAMLKRLQTLEPAGIFARNLAECLRLQAAEQGILTPLLARVLAHLPMLAAADLTGLARVCNASADEVRAVLRTIRSLEPKPGARFDSEPDPIRPPDLIVSRSGDGGWQIELNRSTLPKVQIREAEAQRLSELRAKGQTGREEVASYVTERLAVARWLSRAVEHRNRTVLKVGEEILRRQPGFLEHGPSHLKPMILKEIALAADVHESTVSRVSGGVMLATPHGTFPMKFFFTAALPSRDEAGGSAGAVRHRLERLIRAETPHKPLSDDQLVRLMAEDGVNVARRTVAKDRDQMQIPPASVRRRQAVLSGRA